MIKVAICQLRIITHKLCFFIIKLNFSWQFGLLVYHIFAFMRDPNETSSKMYHFVGNLVNMWFTSLKMYFNIMVLNSSRGCKSTNEKYFLIMLPDYAFMYDTLFFSCLLRKFYPRFIRTSSQKFFFVNFIFLPIFRELDLKFFCCPCDSIF